MKRLNFNIKDRKFLTLGFCLVLVCVFTLTIAYASLNAVLTIQGNAQVTSSDWDIHLANPVVKSGSATTNVPVLKTNSSLEFSTTLNMPGDFYEFTVDVVNAGSIDAMIDNVVKNPELTADQAKFLKYEVSYANGEAITSKQTIAAGVTMPIKVRIEYRNDLVSTDLPTGQVVLDLALTLEYVQSDGSGSFVTGNGAAITNVDLSIDGYGGEGFVQYTNPGGSLESVEFSTYGVSEVIQFNLQVQKNSKLKFFVNEWFGVWYGEQLISWISSGADSDGYYTYEVDIVDDCSISISIDD